MNPDTLSENYKGISASQAKEKLRSEGFNNLPSSKPGNFLSITLGVVKEPMFILLVACGTLYMVMGDIREGIMLLCFVFVIMGIEFFQEKKTEKALDALKDMASLRALVIRDGEAIRIDGFEVVTDDIIVLQEGDRVPADATVLNSVNLFADESLLTGEPVPVRKNDWDGVETDIQPGGDDFPFVYSGSMIVQGNGILAGITLAMAILPEEFPVILTVFMALGAWRMSKKKVLTRNPSTIETLGSATVLCTDKTGTLTQNKMTVARLYNGNDF